MAIITTSEKACIKALNELSKQFEFEKGEEYEFSFNFKCDGKSKFIFSPRLKKVSE